MKITKELQSALDTLNEKKCIIQDGDNKPTITQEWVDAMYKVIGILVDETVETNHTNRSPVDVRIHAYNLYENTLPIMIPRWDWITGTVETKSRALSYAMINLRKAVDVLDTVYSFSPRGT